MRALVFVLVALPLLAASTASGQGRAVDRARAALAEIDPAACTADPPIVARDVRFAIVIHPDGAWALAVGPFGSAGSIPEGRLASLRGCIERALSARLPTILARPPRTVAAVARTWVIVTDAQVALQQRLAAARSAVEACIFAAVPVSATSVAGRVRIVRNGDGTARVEPVGSTPHGSVVARCVAASVGELPRGLATMEYEIAVMRPPPEIVERHDGTAGAVCAWGQRRPDASRLPAPGPCRRGLTCCASGGAAGSDSVCMRVPNGACPMYP